jgi:hypothetical protein
MSNNSISGYFYQNITRINSIDVQTFSLSSTRRVAPSNASLPECPMIPPGLEGRFPVTLADIPQFPAIEAALPQLEKGGRWRPPECTARHKVREAVVLRIRDVYPRIRIFPIPDPGSAIEKFKYFFLTQKIVSKLSEIRSEFFGS